MSRKQKWWLGSGLFAIALVLALSVAVSFLAKRVEPYIRQQVIDYLAKRFESEVQVGRLSVNVPRVPPLKLLMNHVNGVIVQVVGEDIVLRHKGRRDIPPMFSMKRFSFDVDLGRIFDPTKTVAMVNLDHMEIQIPPKGERPSLTKGEKTASVSGEATPSPAQPQQQTQVLIEHVVISDSKLVILPRNKSRKPLQLDLHKVALDSVQMKEPLNYEAMLTNPKPMGLIKSKGTFGPWNANDPSDTPLSGDYVYSDADLGVFSSIAGKMQAKGAFKGTLGSVETKGEANVPDFQLRMAGHPMPLYTRFEATVDGTNGNTILKPVHARLGTTAFTTSGAVVKHEGDARRGIDLDLNMPNGEMKDLLTLAMKQPPFLSGRIQMTAKIRVPPLRGKVKEKLILDGQFSIRKGQFLQDNVQDKIDTLSRRGQGKPGDTVIDNVFSDMAGKFHLEDEAIRFSSLSFGAPGARVDLAGVYDMGEDVLDFNGSLRLDAKVSQTMTGWKKWLLKPIDPVFAKNGAGTFLKIKVTGTSKDPKFGATR